MTHVLDTREVTPGVRRRRYEREDGARVRQIRKAMQP